MKKRKRDSFELNDEYSEKPSHAHYDECNYTWLHYKIINHQLTANFNSLMIVKVNIDAVELDWYYTAMHWAVHLGYEYAVNFLIEHGAKLELKDDEGDTPLHLASRFSNFNIFHKLLVYGANIEAINSKGETPLHLSTKYSHISYVELLIKKGANIEAVNSKGETALFCAFKEYKTDKNFKNINNILIQLGANVNADAATFLNIADDNNDIELIELLISSGLQIDMDLYKSFLLKNSSNILKIELFRLALITDQLLGIDEQKLLTIGKEKDITQSKNRFKTSIERLFKLKKENINNEDDHHDPYYNIFSIIKNRIDTTIFKLNKKNITEQLKILHNNVRKIGLFNLYFELETGKVIECEIAHDIVNNMTIAHIIYNEYIPSLKSIIIDNIVSSLKANLSPNASNKDIDNLWLEFINTQDNKKNFVIPVDLRESFFKALNKYFDPKISSEAYKFIDQQTNFTDLSGQAAEHYSDMQTDF